MSTHFVFVFAPPIDSDLALLVVALIYFAVPVLGLALFLWLRRSLRVFPDASMLSGELFVLFATYGGWLLVALTAAFWYWSGAATLGMAYLLALAPLVTMTIAFLSYRTRRVSRVHAAIFWSATVYVPLLGLAVAIGSRRYGGPF